MLPDVLRQIIRDGAIRLQKSVSFLFPSSFALVTGIPRSGTSALVHWCGNQSRVTAFSETKILRVATQLLKELSQWERFSKEDRSRLARRFVTQYYASAGVYLGCNLLVDKEPFPPEDGVSITSVETVFPSSKILVMVRNPEAVVNSMTNRKWGYSVDGMEPQSRSVQESVEIWNHGATCATKVATRQNALLVSFENLVSNPREVSSQIADFLGLSGHTDFEPRPTSDITQSPDECEKIWSMSREAREKLATKGVAYERETHSKYASAKK
jgi:hypothetical protein